MNLDYEPVGAAYLSDQFLDSAYLLSLRISHGAANEMLDVELTAPILEPPLLTGGRHSHEPGIRLTFRRSHRSNAMIGVLSTDRSRRSEGESSVTREMGIRIGAPRPSPNRASTRATHSPILRLS